MAVVSGRDQRPCWSAAETRVRLRLSASPAWGQAPSRCAGWSQTPCRRPTGDGQPYL